MKHWDTVEAFLKDLASLPAQRLVHGEKESIGLLVMHHTWSPSHKEWHGLKSMEGMRNFWHDRQVTEKWTYPTGGHFVVEPNGGIYQAYDLGIPLNADTNPYANHHGIATEVVGDFDIGHDQLVNPQKHAVYALFGGLACRFNLGPEQVFFHRSFTQEKSCPGTGMNLDEVRQAVKVAKIWAAPYIK